MKNRCQKLILLFLFVLTVTITLGQVDNDKQVGNEMDFELKGDTLFSTIGLKLYVGLQLKVGKPSGEDGQFRAIISRKAAIVPSIWGQDRRYENAIENYIDNKKNKRKLIELLESSETLTIEGIGLIKIGKPYFYTVLLSSVKGKCKADIKLALLLKELLLYP